MLFLTYWFVFFACIAFAIYWLVRVPFIRLPVLLISCLIFHYHFAGPAGVLPIIFLGVVTYFAGLSKNRSAQLAAIVLCALALVFYKYATFLCNEVLGALLPSAGNRASALLAPI